MNNNPMNTSEAQARLQAAAEYAARPPLQLEYIRRDTRTLNPANCYANSIELPINSKLSFTLFLPDINFINCADDQSPTNFIFSILASLKLGLIDKE